MTPDQIKEAFEARQHAAHELRALYTSADGRDLSAEEVAKEAAINVDIRSLDEKVRRGLSSISAEASADEARAIAGLPSADRKPEVKFDEAAELRALFTNVATGKVGKASYEARDLLAGTATDGLELIPKTLYGKIHEHLINNSTVLFAGSTVLRTAGGEDVTIPKTTAYSSAAIVAEAAAISESDPQFTTVVLNAYKYGFLTQVSSELVQDSAFNVQEFLARQGGVALSNGIGAHLITGSGSGQPNGVDNATVGKTTAVNSAITSDELIDTYYSVLAPYRNNASWVFNDTTVGVLRKLKDSNLQYLWQPGLTAGAPDTLLGRPVYTDANLATIATTAVVGVFGDLSGYYTRLAGAVRIDVSSDYAFANDLLTVRFLARADGDIVDTVGIRTLKMAA